MAENEYLKLFAAQENNLKNLDLSFSHNRLIAITGLSGSGKSTLAIDTIYAEGGRRYIETFSPYTRQFLDRLHQPKLAAISGVRPALALLQAKQVTSSRSTVGTVTEINDYLKIIWAHLSTVICPNCKLNVEKDSPYVVLKKIKALSQEKQAELIYITFPLPLSGQASADSLSATLQSQGYTRFYSPSTLAAERLDTLDFSAIEQSADSEILVVVDRIKGSDGLDERALSSINQAYKAGHGKLVAIIQTADRHERYVFFESFVCNSCGAGFLEPKPYMFSFNSPLGACPTCNGFGKTLTFDPKLCIPNENLSINQGALACWQTAGTRRELKKLKDFCEKAKIDLDAPWKKLSSAALKQIFYGDKEKKYGGLKRWFEKLHKKRHKVQVRVFLSRFRSEFTCDTCHGSRLRPEALQYQILGISLPDFWKLPLADALEFAEKLPASQPLTSITTEEVVSRLKYLVDIGLDYLTLDRQSKTLSGGENQRVNLTSILGSRLVNTMLILDEPTIGLHPSDTHRLINTLQILKERGNTVFVVEHDTEVIRSSDEVIDLGPLSGEKGGEVVYQGPVGKISSAPESFTARYLTECSAIDRKNITKPKEFLTIEGAKANNLKNIDLKIPLNKLVALTGVSGSGKSSLITHCLHEPYKRIKHGFNLKDDQNSSVGNLKGINLIDDIVLIDQSPIGRTPRSNPATYTKAWEIFRELLAQTPGAQQLGLSKSAFSFNVDGGRCAVCKGAGQLKVEMQFLADVFVECEACGGTRFKDQVLTVQLAGKNVIELLEMSIEDIVPLVESLGEIENAKKISYLLQPLLELGLGYMRLGHPLNNTSGGEAQRIKIASYLLEPNLGKTLFVLDEPSTGLHPHNILQLVSALRRLVERGHSVLCIEHNLEIIERADWIIDLGPGGGRHGGELVVCGSPAELLESNSDSKTVAVLRARAQATTSNQQIIFPKKAPRTTTSKSIQIIGAREHNLKNISLSIPHNKLIVITGVSGSGKSTLAFDIVFAEGQRRYIDCLSPFARQYIKQLSRAEVDRVSALPPTIAVSQKTSPPLGVSTIATTTELYQYLRLLYAKAGTQHCPKHDIPITSYSASSITQELVSNYQGKRIFIFAPSVSGRKGYYNDLFNRSLKADIREARIDGKIQRLHSDLRLERHKLHWISLLVGSLTVSSNNLDILEQAIEQALLLGMGTVEVALNDKSTEPEIFSTERVCPKCKRGYRALDPQDFSFRSARGVCNKCNGRGKIVVGMTKDVVCNECQGARIAAIGRHVYIEGKRINELTALTSTELLKFLSKVKFEDHLRPVVEPIFRELIVRLKVISEVGLDYLALDRDASSISGGEAQRLRLAKTLGSPLTGVCYVLDEPSIGLHPSDQKQLMSTLNRIRESGNTVIVVEHDEEFIRQAELVIDVGPNGGAAGGELVFQGPVSELERCEGSVTGKALKERSNNTKSISGSKSTSSAYLELVNARTNNLKNVNVKIPLKELTVVAGVSGAGKSSLIHSTLLPAVLEDITHKLAKERAWDRLKGVKEIKRVTEIDQSPVGRSSASTPASFLGIFDEIRKIYGALPEARARGWAANYFSFNTGKGRCSVCGGRGFIKVPMSFLPEAVTGCEACNGMRYSDHTLELCYQGISIGELLKKTMSEAREILANHSKARRTLEYVHELGLGYITLGQPTHTLSGGEAQRLKIARELGASEANDTLYLLDEPTIGLHMIDVEKLVRVLKQLANKGNTVVVIEHNMDVIKEADYLIELGPKPGEDGGYLLFSGTPEELARDKKIKTPTKEFLATSRQQANYGQEKLLANLL